mmetsp:Transcript_13397/g.22028  ORF Transcript_13397/g.22028 Transcript_13397/m.22028 type:complete len:201 (-) Transcript_13397:913-1515(-)
MRQMPANERIVGTTPGRDNTITCAVPAKHIDAPEIAAASVSPFVIKPAVPIECAEHPMATPRTRGDSALKTAGHSWRSELPSEAPIHPVIKIDAMASFGSHSAPIALEPSIPNADITERCSSGRDNGCGMLSGDCGLTAPMAVAKIEKQPDMPHVVMTHLKSLGSSSHFPVVSYIRTPRLVTAAGNHLKNKSPTPLPASK